MKKILIYLFSWTMIIFIIICIVFDIRCIVMAWNGDWHWSAPTFMTLFIGAAIWVSCMIEMSLWKVIKECPFGEEGKHEMCRRYEFKRTQEVSSYQSVSDT